MTIVAVYNMKGGVGKTTCAVNLAYLFAASGQKTLLWDLDAQAASTFALRVKPEVAQFGKPALRNAQVFTEAIRETDHLNLDLLPADFSYRHLDRFLDQLENPKRVMQQMLAQLGATYAMVLLDCPAGFSSLSEAVIACADALLVPTIPSNLSMRTLLRLTQSLDHNAPALLPFVSMVDRRKELHRSLSRWAEQHPELFLREQIPYASSVEQMSVRRAPVAIYDASDPAAKAFAGLWREVDAHIARLAQTGVAPMAAPAVYADRLDALLSTLITDALVHASASAQSTARKDETNALDRDGPQVAFAVDGKDEFQLLERALDKAHSRRAANYVAHTFDTDDATLRRAGYRVQLIEEPERFLISVVKARATQEAELICPREQRSAKIDGGWAAKILTGQLSPISVIDRRIRHPFAAELRALTADRTLARVESSEHKSLRLGPVEFAEGEESASIYLDFDCAEAPGAGTAYCVIASGLGTETESVGRLLGAWRKRSGVRRQLQLLGSSQLAGLENSGQVSGAVSGTESGGSVTPVNE
jgi:cellulose biosynthesis protein BcsQ